MIKYYWITDKELLVNGERMTPEEAYMRFPNYANEIRGFVSKTRVSSDKIFNIMQIPKKSDLHAYTETSYCEEGIDKLVEIKERIHQIFQQLNIKKTTNPRAQFQNAYYLFEYIIKNSHYDSSIMDKKNEEKISTIFEMEINDIYRCLCEKRSVCTSDASALSLLYRMAGIDSKHITIGEFGDKPENVHEVVLMNIEGRPLICDPTLVRATIENGIVPGINKSIFAFSPEEFFSKLYPTREIKFMHKPIDIE